MAKQSKAKPDYPNGYLNPDYVNRLDHIRIYMKDVWAKGTLFHPLFTLHGEQHSNQIERIIEHILAPEHSDHHQLQNLLTSEQLFYLLAATWLHDVGMIAPLNNEEKRIIAELGLSEADWVRDVHHKRSREYVLNHKRELYLRSEEAEFISQVCQAHRKGNLGELSQDYPNLRFLGAILRIADELDISNARTPPQLMELLQDDLDTTSRWHWVKHWCVLPPRPSHEELKDEKPAPLILTYQFIVRLPHSRYKVPFWDRITSPIKDVLDRQDVAYILREKHLAIDVEQFKVQIQIIDDPLPDGTDFDEYFRDLFAFPSVDVISFLNRLKNKNQAIATLLEKQCYKLINSVTQQSEEIRTKFNDALIRFLGALVTANDTSELLDMRDRFKEAIQQALAEVSPQEITVAVKEGFTLAEWGWRLMCIVIGEEDVKLSHLSHVLNALKAEANGLAAWVIGQKNFSAELRKLALASLAQNGTEEFYADIYGATKDSDPGVRAEAVKTLKRIPRPKTNES